VATHSLDEAWLERVLTQPGYHVVTPRHVAEYPKYQAPIPAVLSKPPQLRQRAYAPYRSKTEYLYSRILDTWQTQGQLVRWRYEAVRLALAPHTTLTVDFCLTMPPESEDSRQQLHEVKPAWYREDGWIKLKQAAALWPEYRFFLAQYTKQQWHWKEIPCA
jgi:hypothetical protein